LVVLGALLPLAVGLLPQGDLTISPACEPEGALAAWRAVLQGDRFWRGQLQKLDAEIAWILDEPKRRAQLEQTFDQLNREQARLREQLHRAVPETRPTAAEHQAEELRRAADHIEAAEFQAKLDKMLDERLVQLRSCRSAVASRSGLILEQ
jgi:hypothetical protein